MGGGRGGLGPPLEKLISLAGQKRELGRTEMGAWQDRNGSLAGQKWEAWQKIICKTQHLESFSVTFVYFLPLLVGFCHTFLFFSLFCLWAIPQYLDHLHCGILFFWQKSLRTIQTYHLVPFKLPKNVQGGPFQGLLVFYYFFQNIYNFTK